MQLGIALDHHPEIDVDRPVLSLIPGYDSLRRPDREAITLEHVLTTSSGRSWDEDARQMETEDVRLGRSLPRTSRSQLRTTDRFSSAGP